MLFRSGGMFVLLDERAWTLVGVSSVAGFLGLFVGAKLLAKVTVRNVQVTVAVLLGVLAVALGAGLV